MKEIGNMKEMITRRDFLKKVLGVLGFLLVSCTNGGKEKQGGIPSEKPPSSSLPLPSASPSPRGFSPPSLESKPLSSWEDPNKSNKYERRKTATSELSEEEKTSLESILNGVVDNYEIYKIYKNGSSILTAVFPSSENASKNELEERLNKLTDWVNYEKYTNYCPFNKIVVLIGDLGFIFDPKSNQSILYLDFRKEPNEGKIPLFPIEYVYFHFVMGYNERRFSVVEIKGELTIGVVEKGKVICYLKKRENPQLKESWEEVGETEESK